MIPMNYALKAGRQVTDIMFNILIGGQDKIRHVKQVLSIVTARCMHLGRGGAAIPIAQL